MPPEEGPATLVFLRHGETDWNRQRRVMGDHDVPLSQDGRRQCEATAVLLQDFGIERVLSSPLQRARETAEILAAALAIPVQYEEGLVEVRFGDWQGKTYDEIMTDPRFVAFAEDPVAHPTPGGETIADVQARGLASVARVGPGQSVLIVSHGDIIRSVLCHYLAVPLGEFRRIRIDNCGLAAVAAAGSAFEVKFVNMLADPTRVLDSVHWGRGPQEPC